MNVIEALAHSSVCVEDVDVILTFAYLELDQLLRMPHDYAPLNMAEAVSCKDVANMYA